jgi:hypothetical protein
VIPFLVPVLSAIPSILAIIRRYWYLVVIALLVLRLWWVSTHRPEGDGHGPPGSTVIVGPDSVVVRTQPIIVREPIFVDRLLGTKAAKEYQRRIDDLIAESAVLKRALDAERAKPRTVSVLHAVGPADSVFFKVGDTLEHPAVSVSLKDAGTYRLILKPRKYRLSIVEAKSGSVYADLEDQTLGKPIRITDLQVTRLADGWRRRWLRWDLGIGVGSSGDESGWNVRGGVSPLSFERGRTRVDLLRIDADRWGASLEVVRVGG